MDRNMVRYRPEDHAIEVQGTPSHVIEPIRALLDGIDLDPCTEPNNPLGAKSFYALPQNGLTMPWDVATVYVNPPYGAAKHKWIKRCIDEGQRRKVVLLIPSHTETRVFQNALRACVSVVFISPRLTFNLWRYNGRRAAASHGSALFGFGVDVAPLRTLGTVMKAC